MKMKKILSAILAGTMLLSSMTALAADEPALPEYSCEAIEGEDLLVTAEPLSSGAKKNFRLDAGMVFSALEDAETAAKSAYADWLVDCEIVFSEDTTAQLMGAYSAIRNGAWQFAESLDFEGGKVYKVLEESGLDKAFENVFGSKNTYASIAEYVKVFKSGAVFDKETKEGTTVAISLTLTNPETDETKVVGTETFTYKKMAMPEYNVTELVGDDLVVDAEEVTTGGGYLSATLDVGLQFSAAETPEEAKAAVYADWIPEYEIEFSNETTAQLMGAYDAIRDGAWQSLGSYVFEAGKTYNIMEESTLDKVFANLFGAYNYANIVEYVKVFKCGIKYESIPFDTDVTLRLCIKDNFSGEKYVLFEETYTTETLHETTDTDEQIAENINNLPQEKVEVFAESIKETIKELDQESKDSISSEVIKTLVADQVDEDATEPKAYSTDTTIDVSVDDITEDGVETSSTFDVVVEDQHGNELDSVPVPVLVAIPLPAGVDADDIASIVHEHEVNGVVTYKEITNFHIENGILYFHMSEFSNIIINYVVYAAPDSAVLKLVESAVQVGGKATYDIVLEGENENAIKYLLAGEFTVVTDGVSSNVVIEATDGATATAEGNGKYSYKLDMVNNQDYDKDALWTATVTNKQLVLGKLVVTARGTGNVKLKDIKMEKHDGTDHNGAVEIPTEAGAAVMFDIKPVKHMLKVNVEFYNEIAENDDNAMTITISGGDLATDKEFKIAQNVQGVNYVASTCTYSVDVELSENTEYCVTVEGAGYRTATYYVNMQDTDKTLNFWNNAENVAKEVEVNNTDSAVKTNFLAGDIVEDNQINIYDLSAVVSYFGEDGIDAANSHVQYDLNRDGKIDSMDVAYVLVSWNK